MATSDPVWQLLYKRMLITKLLKFRFFRWPLGFSLERKLGFKIKKIYDFLNDWYNVYQQHYILDKQFQCVCVDIGSWYFKYHVVGSPEYYEPVPSICGEIYQIHFNLPGSGEDENLLVGWECLRDNLLFSRQYKPYDDSHSISNIKAIRTFIKWIYRKGLYSQKKKNY